MMDVLSIALSGLSAQKQRLAVSASNIANASTSGTVPEDSSSEPASTVYRALETNLSTQALLSGQGVGVVSNITEKEQPYALSYDPSSIYANADGLIAVPNVDFEEEIINVMLSEIAYKANIAVIKTEKELSGALLDVMT